ncbi:polysaccharide deacetylase family protein [Bacillus sp. A301a_S52]|jgi:probable sporulation protein (polysaccharide deacetylase family)|nr:polysaccharide deacetylase family protein [Bacillus sp. A301a_S52]
MLKKVAIQLGTFFFLLIVTLSHIQNPVTGGYIEELRGQAEQVMKEESPLYMEILRVKQEYEDSPINARIDPVWKAVPGYNGREVDVQKSYENMKKRGDFQEEALVFKEISPEITLKDLPPSPIYRGNPDKPMVGFMVNVAWGNDHLPDILKTFKENNVKATFFLDGSWVKNNSNLAMMIKEEGHEIGNHAYSHPDMKRLARESIRDEIIRTNEVIDAALNEKPVWFAPPSGSFREDVVTVASELNMYTILWTVDTVDWKNPSSAQMTQRVVNHAEPGSLILMHPTASSANGLEAMITGLKNKNLHIGKVSEVLSEKRLSD